MTNDTIFALSTAPGAAAIAVLRVSGPAARMALERVAGSLPPPRRLHLADLIDPASGEKIDRGLVAYFAGPGSVTGEDLAEFHVHGGSAVIAALLQALAALPGYRLAEPGEFTRRGFENGKLDLSAAEGIADLIAAETAAQRRLALTQAEGGFARIADGWTIRLTRILAHLEAAIDFADEELPGDLFATVVAEAARLQAEIAHHLADGGRGEILRHGLSVALVGPPNGGKSSLLNRLAGREAAIVSATAGTTRDVIEVRLDLSGYPVILADTAGLRDSDDPIEREGIQRARARAQAADLVVLVLDASAPQSLPETDCMIVLNKCDLAEPPAALSHDPDRTVVAVSALTGAGVDRLVAAIGAVAGHRLAGEAPLITRARHRSALEAAAGALARAAGSSEVALAAEDLRLALRSLGRITGRVDVEDLLDVIFRDFCLGK